ncbi:hypothetical protein FHG87_023921 [Trinorchestia longiramus]|nr:hypothetical protein FHG87_023921 [Trinorchestia longiramus]
MSMARLASMSAVVASVVTVVVESPLMVVVVSEVVRRMVPRQPISEQDKGSDYRRGWRPEASRQPISEQDKGSDYRRGWRPEASRRPISEQDKGSDYRRGWQPEASRRPMNVDTQLGRVVSESACEREDPGSNPAAAMVDAARITAWDLGNRIIIEVII